MDTRKDGDFIGQFSTSGKLAVDTSTSMGLENAKTHSGRL